MFSYLCATLVVLSPKSDVRRHKFNGQNDRPYGELQTYFAEFWFTFCENPPRGLRDASKMFARIWVLFLVCFTTVYSFLSPFQTVTRKFTVAPSTFILLDLSDKRNASSFFGSLPLHLLLYRAVNLDVYAQNRLNKNENSRSYRKSFSKKPKSRPVWHRSKIIMFSLLCYIWRHC